MPEAVPVPRLSGSVAVSSALGGLIPAVRGALVLAPCSLGAGSATVPLAPVTGGADDHWQLAAIAEETPLRYYRPN